MKTALLLEDVSYTYHSLDKETLALSHISMQIEAGEFVAIIGPSGCGKSTLLHLISRLLPLQKGNILINQVPLANSGEPIGYMLQTDQLLPWKTIYENAILGLQIHHVKDPMAYEYANELLQIYGLTEFCNSYPHQLSGGMRQRVALIRTLVLSPQIMLLDEPFSALDFQTRLQVSNDIGHILKKEKKTALLVTHDLSEAISLADRVIVLSKRPGTVKSIFPICLTYPDKSSPNAARNAIEFNDYFNILWRELND